MTLVRSHNHPLSDAVRHHWMWMVRRLRGDLTGPEVREMLVVAMGRAVALLFGLALFYFIGVFAVLFNL
ncbi:MAG: hypothetical protein KDA28_10410 [Phycisphaerales bacterium]|nr:hypothetical protein [Phycisphaerales bacterium]